MTEQDLHQISKLLGSKLEPMQKDIAAIREDISSMKEDLKGLNIAIQSSYSI